MERMMSMIMEDEDRESKRDRGWLRPRRGMQRYCVIKQVRQRRYTS